MSTLAPTGRRGRISDDEWRCRVNLAAAYRLGALFRGDLLPGYDQ